MNVSEENDAALMKALCAGNTKAFDCLVDRYGIRAFAFVCRLVKDRNLAEDIVQDIFLKIWQRPDLYRPERAAFVTWLFRLLRNRAIDTGRRPGFISLPDNWDKADPAESQHETLDKMEKAKNLECAISGLPDRQQEAVRLCYMDDMSNQEAAFVMDIHIKALESLLTRARQNLRKSLKGQKKDFLEV